VTRLLAIETSSTVGSVALAVDGDVREATIPVPREQTARILPLIEQLLGEAGIELGSLDAVVFGRGPGSFTGLRVAAAIAQGLALATGLPIVAVSSLAALAGRAAAAERAADVLVCIDARMGEVYSAYYRVAVRVPELVGAETIGAPEAVTAPAADDWLAVGDGFAAHGAALERVAACARAVLADASARARDLVPLAEHELAAGRTLEPEQALPVYLREASAWHR